MTRYSRRISEKNVLQSDSRELLKKQNIPRRTRVTTMIICVHICQLKAGTRDAMLHLFKGVRD